jgi:hypothetical protein
MIDSGGMVIFSINPVLTRGSKRTADFAEKHRQPCVHVHPAMELQTFLQE